MNTLINLAVKWSGFGWIWGKLDGYKLYGTGALAILTGLVEVFTQLAPILAAHDSAGLFSFVTHIAANDAWKTVLLGAGAIAAAHKADKMTAAAAAAPSAAPAQ